MQPALQAHVIPSFLGIQPSEPLGGRDAPNCFTSPLLYDILSYSVLPLIAHRLPRIWRTRALVRAVFLLGRLTDGPRIAQNLTEKDSLDKS